MSVEQNIKTAQKAYADFSRGDIPALLAALDDNIVWITPEVELPTGGTRHGKQEVARFFQIVADTWEFTAFEPKEYIASGDQLAVCGSYSAKARSTGREVTCDWTMVWKFRDGKVVRFQEYTDTSALKKAALQAVAA